MTVVLGPGWPGILLHEAIGHGLEGDFNRKGTSAFAGRLGERVAAPGVTVVDDGTLPGRRGSLNVDDEGTPTQRTVLIEDGILRGYLHDRQSARLMDMAPTGNGRRESYAHLPMPRMTNTFMLAGEEAPEDILRSVDRGIYAVHFGGGQVDITSGKFVFSASEAYEIENGRIGAPLKGATLIGNGPDVLTRVSRIGHDLALDRGVGTCGKDGQVGAGGRGPAHDPRRRPHRGRHRGMNLRDTALLAVESARAAGADAVDTVVVESDSVETRVRGEEIDYIKQARERSVGIRALVRGARGTRQALTSTRDLSENAVREMASQASALARSGAEDPAAGLPESGFADPDDLPDLSLWDPADRDVDVEMRVDAARRAERAARETDPWIVNSEGSQVSSAFSQVVYANSLGFLGGYESASHALFSEPLARNGTGMQRDYWMSVSRRIAELESPEAVGTRAAQRALRRLGARRLPTCEVPVIFDPLTAASLWRQVAGLLNGYAVYRGTSFLADKLGELVAAPDVQLVDDPLRPGGLGSRPFDGEGLPSRRTLLIERGKVASFLLDSYSARKLGSQSTGHASRSARSSPGAGATNLYLEPGSGSLEDLIADTPRGLLVTELIGMGFNPVTGDYSRGAAGLWVENGKISHPVEEVTIAANFADMLQRIDGIADDLLWLSSVASPSLRISQMTVAGEA